MKPVINSHLDYRRFLNGIGGMYRINWRSKPPAIREIYLRFRELDLSAVDRIMQDQYSSRGAEPRPPSCMLRSLLLMIVMNVVSVTHWAATLHTSQFFAVLSGFQPWDIPGVGTFYDFIDRLWNYATPNFSPQCKPPVRKKVKKPKEKGQKAAPIEKESVADLIIRLSQATFSTDGNPHDQLGSPRIIPTTTGYFLWVSTTLVCCALLFLFCRFFAPLLLLALPFLGLCRLFTAYSECTFNYPRKGVQIIA